VSLAKPRTYVAISTRGGTKQKQDRRAYWPICSAEQLRAVAHGTSSSTFTATTSSRRASGECGRGGRVDDGAIIRLAKPPFAPISSDDVIMARRRQRRGGSAGDGGAAAAEPSKAAAPDAAKAGAAVPPVVPVTAFRLAERRFRAFKGRPVADVVRELQPIVVQDSGAKELERVSAADAQAAVYRLRGRDGARICQPIHQAQPCL